MRQTDSNMVFSGGAPAGAGSHHRGGDGRRASVSFNDRRSSMQDGSDVSHLDNATGRSKSFTHRGHRATEGNLDLSDDHIERHIARTLAMAAARRRVSMMQVGQERERMAHNIIAR
jgi:hypothetical protein